jgi:hypothetical protein
MLSSLASYAKPGAATSFHGNTAAPVDVTVMRYGAPMDLTACESALIVERGHG